MTNLKIAVLAALFAVGWPIPALAQPVYLECDFKQPSGAAWIVQISADEVTGEVTATMPNGRSYRYQAAFTPAEVSFSDRNMSYTISRLTLKAVRLVPSIRRRTETTCTLVDPPVRAF